MEDTKEKKKRAFTELSLEERKNYSAKQLQKDPLSAPIILEPMRPTEVPE